jgi:hypothetical protein
MNYFGKVSNSTLAMGCDWRYGVVRLIRQQADGGAFETGIPRGLPKHTVVSWI